jgi:predicted transposase YbfD/YdcC
VLGFFRKVLSSLPDPRREQGMRYPLVSVVVTARMAMVRGADNAEEMEDWGAANRQWLDGILALPHGTPTQDVFLSVFGTLEPTALYGVSVSWGDLLRMRLRMAGKHIAVDGKTSRRSFDTGRGLSPIHTVSAWLSDEGLGLGQVKTAGNSNEITAIPGLLRTIDLRGATVTIDAMGCQTEATWPRIRPPCAISPSTYASATPTDGSALPHPASVQAGTTSAYCTYSRWRSVGTRPPCHKAHPPEKSGATASWSTSQSRRAARNTLLPASKSASAAPWGLATSLATAVLGRGAAGAVTVWPRARWPQVGRGRGDGRASSRASPGSSPAPAPGGAATWRDRCRDSPVRGSSSESPA